MNWEHHRFGAKPGQPGREVTTADGIFRIPPIAPVPRRESYFAASEAKNWYELSTEYVEFWKKVAEVLPLYYRVAGAQAENVEPVPPDNGWDRIVCLLDIGNGKLSTNLWKGTKAPEHCDRVWIILKSQWIIDLTQSRDRTTEMDSVYENMHLALAGALRNSMAKVAMDELQRWRPFTLWTAAWDDGTNHRFLY